MKLLSVSEGRRERRKWGMASHMERINLFSFFIAAALFTSAVNAQQKYLEAEHGFGRPITSPYRHLLSKPNPSQKQSKPSPPTLPSPSPPTLPTPSPPTLPTPSPPTLPSPSPPTLPTPSPPTPSQPTTSPPSPPTPSQPTTSPPSPPTPSPPSPPTPPPAPGKLPSPPREGDKKKSTGTIVGSLLASIAVFALIGVAIAWKYKKKQANVDPKQPVTPQQSSNDGRALLPIIGTSAETPPNKAANKTPRAETTLTVKESRSHAAMDAPTKTANRTALADTSERDFTYNEILKITGNFGVVIGKGRSAIIYSGQLQDGGLKVAVKKLRVSGSQLGNLLAEVKNLMRIHHSNLVSLVGFYQNQDQIILVYEYMANGSLSELLKARAGELTWRKRLQIALDAATGLEFLHTGCKSSIIHRDITSANILLNENLEAKLANFGLSKAGAVYEIELSSSHTKTVGTAGYIDPEYLYTQTLTKMSDVYSFGIVLLELVTGQAAVTKEKLHLTKWIVPKLERGERESLLDPLMKENCNIESVKKVVAIAKASIEDPSGRPDMTEIVNTLKEALRMETSPANLLL